MKVGECKKGMRVVSTSNSFTRGKTGVVLSFGSGGDPPEPAAFVQFDGGGPIFAVAIRLLEPSP